MGKHTVSCRFHRWLHLGSLRDNVIHIIFKGISSLIQKRVMQLVGARNDGLLIIQLKATRPGNLKWTEFHHLLFSLSLLSWTTQPVFWTWFKFVWATHQLLQFVKVLNLLMAEVLDSSTTISILNTTEFGRQAIPSLVLERIQQILHLFIINIGKFTPIS